MAMPPDRVVHCVTRSDAGDWEPPPAQFVQFVDYSLTGTGPARVWKSLTIDWSPEQTCSFSIRICGILPVPRECRRRVPYALRNAS